MISVSFFVKILQVVIKISSLLFVGKNYQMLLFTNVVEYTSDKQGCRRPNKSLEEYVFISILKSVLKQIETWMLPKTIDQIVFLQIFS